MLKHAVENRKVTLDDLTSKTAEMYETLVETLPRRELFREMIRVAAHENMEATADSIGWRLVIALRASLHSAAEEERDPDLAQWMNDSAVSLREYTISTLYKPLAAAFELEPRPQYGERAYELGEVCMAAISEGFSMRYWLDSRQYLDGLEHHDIVGGEANWSMYSMLFEQAVEMFFVPKSGSWDDF